MYSVSAVQAKLAAVDNVHHEDQTKLNHHIQKVQGENASLRDEKRNLVRKMEGLENEVKQG